MKAYVISDAGGPEKLVLSDLDTPKVKPGWVLIKVRAFGLNRSEWFTRRGESPSVKFPRVLGIECVGEVADSLNPKVVSTTRSDARIDSLKRLGAADVIVDKGAVANEMRKKYPEGVDRVLELVGAGWLLDSLKTVKRGGIVCMTGGLGGPVGHRTLCSDGCYSYCR